MTKLEKAEQTALTAIPARISFAEVAFPPMFAMAITAKEVIIAPMKAVIPTEFPPRKLPIPSMMASVAPRDAPDEIPSTYGSASGFCTIACITTPHTERAIPTARARRTLGSRISHTTS